MTSKDQLKLINAGFTIIRADFTILKIKVKGESGHEWRHMQGDDFVFRSKAALQRQMDFLLEDQKTVED